MAYDFPTSPAVGTLFAPPGGPTWRWSGSVWSQIAPSGLVPEAPLDWHIYARQNALWTPIDTAQRYNHVVNGAMLVSQENVNAAGTVSGYHPADQWFSSFNSTGTITAIRSIGSGFLPYVISLSASPAKTSAAAGEYIQFVQKIEGNRLVDFYLGTASFVQMVISFYVNLPVAGTYWVCLSTGTGTHSWLGSYSIAAGEVSTWVRRQVVIPAGAINAGTWPADNTNSASLHFALMSGSTYTGVAGFQAGNFVAGPGQAFGLSTVNAAYITNVGIYLDPNNTGVAPPWEMPDYATELIACQRYYQRNVFLMLSCNCTAASTYYTIRPLGIPVRATPVLSGTDVPNASGFPTATGTLQFVGDVNQAVVRESRVCNLTGPSAFQSSINANARM